MSEQLSSNEPLHTVLLQLTAPVRSRLRRFFNRQEFIGMRPSDIIGVLLDREGVYPENTHSYSKRRRATSPGANQVASVQQHESNFDRFPIAGRSDTDHRANGNFEDDFLEEGEILDDDDDILLANDDYAGDVVSGARDRNELRNDLEQRLEYYSAATLGGGPTDQQLVFVKDPANSSFRPVLGSQRQWNASLRRYWYGLVVKWQKSGLLQCRMCDTCMDVVVRGVGLRAGNAFDHVCKHFGKELFVCRICHDHAVTSMEMRDHVRSVHQSDARSLVDFLDVYNEQLERMIAYCFEKPPVVPLPVVASPELVDEHAGKLRKKRRGKEVADSEYQLLAPGDSLGASVTARQFCCQLIAKWQRNDTLYCRECDQWLRVAAKNNWLRGETAMQHICGHLGQPLYKCRQCPQSTATSRQMRQHLQTIHKSGIRDQYVDLTGRLEFELKEMAALCFDWSEGEDGPPANDGRFLRPRVRAGLENDSNRQEALARCRLLIQSTAAENRMLCNFCGTAFVAMTANGYPLAETVYNHCLKHIDPPPYACRACSKRTHNSANMRTHIWTKHKEMPVTEFIDYTNAMHDGIMSMLDDCFGTSGNEDEVIAESEAVQNVEAVDDDAVNQQESVISDSCFLSPDKRIVLVNSDRGTVTLIGHSYGDDNATPDGNPGCS